VCTVVRTGASIGANVTFVRGVKTAETR
jgi:hypothetical protein